jgi:glycosyltransferase involved in cell wall biosynthesis
VEAASSARPATHSRLRIGLFCFPRLIHGGGFEEYLIALAKSLSARGHAVCVISASPGQYRALNVALNVYYRNPLFHDNSRLTVDELRSQLGDTELFEVPVWKMRGLLRRCDVVYAKNELLDLSVIQAIGIKQLPPVICGVHTPMWYPHATSRQARLHNRLYLGGVYRRLLRGVSDVHVSNSNDASLFPRVHEWPSERLVNIPYPYAADAGNTLVGTAPDGRLRVLWAARMTEQKGVDTLVGVIHSINGSPAADRYAFVIAGTGDPQFEREVRLAAARYSNVRYVGHVPHERMPSLYHEADAALVTSNWETLPYSCLEPQSRGVPVVASDIPGCSDIVEHGATGFLFRPGDIDAAVAALHRIGELQSRSPAELDAMRHNAQLRVHERFDPRVINDALERMLLDVATGSAMRRAE